MMDYTTVPFANLYKSSISVDENVGKITLPVKLSSYSGDNNTSVTFKVVEGTAKEGVNFTVEPAGKILSFNGTDSLAITINVIGQTGVYTGDLKFKVELDNATNDYQVGGTSATTVTIKDIDHPLANFAGSWKVSCSAPLYGPLEYRMTLDLDSEDATVVWCNYIVPMLYAYSTYGSGWVKGIVSKDKTTITFASQPLDARNGKAFDLGYNTGTLCLYSGTYKYVDGGDNDEYETYKDPIIFTKAEGDGLVFKSKTGICIADDYIWPSWYGWLLGEDNDAEIVWTKE